MSTQPIANCGDRRPWLKRLIPALDWLRHYERKHLPGDALAGVIVATLLIPQAMAYALLGRFAAAGRIVCQPPAARSLCVARQQPVSVGRPISAVIAAHRDTGRRIGGARFVTLSRVRHGHRAHRRCHADCDGCRAARGAHELPEPAGALRLYQCRCVSHRVEPGETPARRAASEDRPSARVAGGTGPGAAADPLANGRDQHRERFAAARISIPVAAGSRAMERHSHLPWRNRCRRAGRSSWSSSARPSSPLSTSGRATA